MLKVSAKAPTRIDLAGGTLDLWPLHHLLDRKATVNLAVTLFAETEVVVSAAKDSFALISEDQGLQVEGSFSQCGETTKLPLLGLLLKALWQPSWPGICIRTRAKSPAGAGLGGSSCLAVTVLAALSRARHLLQGERDLDEGTLVSIAEDVESAVIKAPTGCQDYWGAVRGGLNVFRFAPGRFQVDTDSSAQSQTLNDGLILCYSGRSRASAINNWEIFKRAFDGDQQLIARLNKIGAVAEACAAAFQAGDMAAGLRFSKDEWELRKVLWPNIVTGETEALHAAALKAGASFSRVCGAGGGGVMAVFAAAERKPAVSAALTKAGGQVLDAGVSRQGLQVHHE